MPVLAVALALACLPTLLVAAEPPRGEPHPQPAIVEFRTYRAAADGLDALHARLRDVVIPTLARHGVTTQAVLVPAGDNPDRLVFLLTAAASAEAMEAGWKGLDAGEATERLVTTAWSPPFTPAVSATPRVFERRTYTCPDPAKHEALLRRFHDHTLALFAKHGMQNIVYWVPADPPAANHRLVYLLGHANEAAAKASFAAFRQDPDWLAARRASEERAGGSLTTAQKGVVSEFLAATDYSPLR